MWLQESFQETRIQEGGGGARAPPRRGLGGRAPTPDPRSPSGAPRSAEIPPGLRPARPTAGLHRGGKLLSLGSDVIGDVIIGQRLTPC